MKKHPVPVVVGAEQADEARARGEALTSAIVRDLATLTETFWLVGKKLHAMVDERLYLALGYDNFPAYVEGRLGVALAQAYKMVRVVRNYVQADAERVGIERADYLIRYAKHVGVDPGELVRSDAQVGDKPLSQASVRDIAVATQAALKAKLAAQKTDPATRERNRENRAVSAHVTSVLSASGVRGAGVKVVGNEVVIRLDRAKLLALLGR